MVRNNQILKMGKLLLLCFLVSVILQGCSGGTAPSKEEITGTWVNADGAVLVFRKDGSFTGKSLPAGIFVSRKAEYKGKYFDGSGIWSIKGEKKSWDQLPWKIYLDFKETSEPKYRCVTLLLVSGSNFLENIPPWNYLFMWEEEEGGARYKFEKQ